MSFWSSAATGYLKTKEKPASQDDRQRPLREIAEIVGCSKSTVVNILNEAKPKEGEGDADPKKKHEVNPYDRKQFSTRRRENL